MSDNSKPYKSQWPLRYVMDSELINSKLLGVLLILAISGCSPATSTDINQHTDARSVSTSSTSIAKHSDPDMTYPTHLAKRFPRLPDIAHLSRSFKNRFGCSPKKMYRKDYFFNANERT